jgi:DNA (cytosine-5)-methyltransferase 3A
MEKMNVLSLFDGMSCGRQALERSGIEINNYYASEIDKYAIQVTMANYPNTIQLGSVTELDGYSLPKIDMLIGGSPCQSFSFAGKRKGMSTKCETEILTLDQYLELKNEGFEFEGQSFLFWEYMRLLNEVKPKYFLLENVMMSEKWEKILTQAIGINPIMINSSLVSAQNRKRFYWTNIGAEPDGFFGDLVCKIKQPKDKKILLKDILEKEVDEKYFLSDTRIETINKSDRSLPYIDSETKKHNCLIAGYSKIPTDGQYIVHNLQTRSADRPSLKNNKNAGGSGHLSKSDGKTYCLDTGNTQAVEITGGDFDGNFRERPNGKSGTLRARAREDESCSQLASINSRIRRLTPTECERLQTVKDSYTNHVSDSQRYKMLGNGWTVDVIAYIFSHIKQ